MRHSYGKCKTCGDSLRKVHEHWMTKPLMLCFKCEGIRKPAAKAQEGEMNNLPTLTGLLKELDADLADASESNLVHIEITDPAHAARLRSDIVRLVRSYRTLSHLVAPAARIAFERTGGAVDVSGFPT